jgi:hypothetical protein
MIAEALEVLVEVHDADVHVLGSSGNRQVGERETVGPVAPGRCQLTHGRQDRTLNGAIHGYLSHRVQGSLDRGDPVRSSCVNHQLVAHRPTPAKLAALDCAKQ